MDGGADCGCVGGAEKIVAVGAGVMHGVGTAVVTWAFLPVIIACMVLVLISIFFIIGKSYTTGFTLMGLGIAVPAGIFFLASKV